MASSDLKLMTNSVLEIERISKQAAAPVVVSIVDPLSDVSLPVVAIDGKLEFIDARQFDPFRTRPVRRKGKANLTSLESLIGHIQRFKSNESVVFANDDRKAPAILAVLNYQGEQPDFGDHRAHYTFPLSDEWKLWGNADKQQMEMAAFAAFLEDNINDVIALIDGEDQLSEELQRYINTCGGGKPASPSALVELSRRLDVNENISVKNAVKLSSGEGEISFSTEHVDSDGKPVKVPGLFLIAIPVFRGGPLYRIAVRLRYRVRGAVVFWFEMWRADKAFDAAFRESCERVSIETELPLLYGAPEA